MKKPMKLGEPVLKVLNKKYEPLSMVNLKFKGYDLVIKTDEDGNPILLFMGKMNDKGIVKGDRFTRTIKKDQEGKILKDYWDLKGKAT